MQPRRFALPMPSLRAIPDSAGAMFMD